jgi:hypothetical protein
MRGLNNDLLVRAGMANLGRATKTRPPTRGALQIRLDARRERRNTPNR